jgi:long-chain acyl-CoA synthetase
MHILRGSRHVVPLSGGFDANEILTLAPQLGNVSMFAAPTMVRRLVDCAKERNEDGDGIRTIVYAGGPMYLADIIEAVDVMGPRFVQVLGQGECPMAITALSRAQVSDRDHPRWRERLGSVGVAQSAVSVQIMDAAGNVLLVDEIGEICVAGLPVMAGYWKNRKATCETIVEGWLKTGDMGAMDLDGFVTLHDRAKDMIISGGSNIYPREVEEVLLLHPRVAEVSVVGKSDLEWGEVVVAFVVGTGIDTCELDAYCLDNIARFKRPKLYRFVPELPKNNYGKVLKTELRALLDS